MSENCIIDNFAGGGGASEGIVAAIGRPVDVALNHNADALAMHEANHPETRHIQQNVWSKKAEPQRITEGRTVPLAWFSPDCFPAGTMVLTQEGYIRIEEILPGDRVLTHQCRWRRVTDTMSTVKPILRIQGHGHPGLSVSEEHPFLARRRRDVWNNKRRSYDRTLEPSDWIPAYELESGWYWATPILFPASRVPPIPVRHLRKTAVSAELFWLVGRYIADGWTRLNSTRGELVITCGLHEVDGLRQRLNSWPRAGSRSGSNEIAWHERKTGTAYQFSTNHKGLVEWLRQHFGHGAAEKRIPGWALGMARVLREALLEGYASGDGHLAITSGTPVRQMTTVSKALAFGIKALAGQLGHAVTVYTGANRNIIEGRTVNALPYWSVRWHPEPDAKHSQTIRENDLEWSPVRGQSHTDEISEVYNLSVEEDESYVVEGIVVHNCTHFSKAKGGKPVSKKIRGLANIVHRWAKNTDMKLFFLENVEEFQGYGPVDKDGFPIKAREGELFKRWLGKLRDDDGFNLELRMLRGMDYGAPTSRTRLFIIGRRDGLPIVWPEPSHDGLIRQYRTAADCIDWSIPCPSIFDRERPLAEKTMHRIARGVVRYVINNPRPFIVPLTHHGSTNRVYDINDPFRCITGAHRGEFALAMPLIVPYTHGDTASGPDMRAHDITEPFRTITTLGAQFHLVTAFMAQHNTGMVGHPMTRPVSTIVEKGCTQALVTAHIQRDFGQSVGHRADQPIGSITASGGGKSALVASSIVKLKGTCRDGQPMDAPLHTIQAGGLHYAEVRAFLLKYYGTDQFVTTTIDGEPYAIVDIGMRMLTPRELFRAQGFRDSYIIDPMVQDKRVKTREKLIPMPKTGQIRMCGNSVCPDVAEALVRANYHG